MAKRASAPKNLSEEKRLAKNKAIREKGMATRARRAKMRASVVDLKITTSSLSKKQKEALERLFLEYKWLRNAAVAAFRFDLKYLTEVGSQVPVKLPDGSIQHRELKYLGSQMRQQVIKELNSNLKTLATLKAKGKKTGSLKFVSEVKSIDLQQFGVTYQLVENNGGKFTKVRVQNVPGRMRVRGFGQLAKEGIEFANAKLVRRADGFHLLVTTYVPKVARVVPAGELGVDFGVKNSFTLSDGSVVNAVVGESERLRRLQRKLSRQSRGSNGYKRTLGQLARERQRMVCRRDDFARKLVREWLDGSVVFFQDENISSWARRGGCRGSRRVQFGVLGRVKSLLRGVDGAVMLPRWVATTAWCFVCGARTGHGLGERVFVCGVCGFSEDRDVHAARNMIVLGKRFSDFTSGTEGCAGGGDVRLRDWLYEPVGERLPVKPETACALGAP